MRWRGGMACPVTPPAPRQNAQGVNSFAVDGVNSKTRTHADDLYMSLVLPAVHLAAFLRPGGVILSPSARHLAPLCSESFCRGNDILSTGPSVSARAVVNVLGRWYTYKQWDTIGIAKELDEILDGVREYDVVEIPPGEDRDNVGRTPRRRDFCKRKGVVQRYIFNATVPLLPFENLAMAESVGTTVADLDSEPLEPLAIDIVFDALSQSISGIVDKELIDARRKLMDAPGGAFDADAFADCLNAARRTVLTSLAIFPGSFFILFAITALKLDAASMVQESAGDILGVIQSNLDKNGPVALLLPFLPFSLVIYGAKNPPKTNRAVQEAAAVDKIFLATRIAQRQVTDAETPETTVIEENTKTLS